MNTDTNNAKPLLLLQQAFDALEATADSDLDCFEDEEEEAEAVPMQYAARKIMQAMEMLAPNAEVSGRPHRGTEKE